MKYFKDLKGMIHALESDGSQDHLIQDNFISITLKEFEQYIQSKINPIKLEIDKLEQEISPRRLREALLGLDNGWLKQQHDKIVELENQLKGN